MVSRSKEATLIIASSESDSNLFYATRFMAPDPFIYLEVAGRKILVMSDLELDRAKKEASVDEIISSTSIVSRLKKRGESKINSTKIVDFLLKDRDIKKLLVPGDFPIQYADTFRAAGYEIQVGKDPFYPQRMIKSKDEVEAIAKTLRHTEQAIEAAISILKRSKIKGKYLIHRGKRLTSEDIKQVINVSLMEAGCIAAHTIVSCGKQCVDPHDQGSGPFLAHQSIIMDVFPHSSGKRYFADTTRTVVRGKASAKLKKMYHAVAEGQEIAFRQIRHGAHGKKIHTDISNYFESLGFKTGTIGKRIQGFFHGTGHGVGLDIHEPPRISIVDDVLKAGQVVTVEPGLYYADAGGVRLEDMVLVTKTGCRNLSKLPKVLEI